ncbi:MAG: carboxypeptidase regulatory-like domain-containing protein [Candidatus Sulfotelmatobacter sp.]
MTRIHQQVSSGQHNGWSQFGVRCMQVASRATWLCAALLLMSALAIAQSTSLLNGSVTDSSGAAVTGAQITLSNPATGLQRTTQSNGTGLYQFLDVPPGTYRLDVSATGFAPYSVANVTLLVKLPSTVRIQLHVGGVTQSVTVEGQAPLINRTDASLGNVVEQDQIQELPIADRNVVNLLSLQPGVAYLGIQSQAVQNTDTRSGAVNGLRSDQSNVTLDGIGVNDENNGYAFNSVLNVPPDSVEEFRVTTANSNADSGYSSGAQVALVTKSGTNNFHGSAYEYNRNTIFSANDPFLKASQVEGGESNTAPKLLRNVFGVTFGGPIKKNRLFFFTNYEGRRDAQGTSVLRTVPSAALRAGILQYQCQAQADGSPNTACPGGSVTVNTTTVNVQPGFFAMTPQQVTGIDPAGIGASAGIANILSQYPMPNAANAGDTLNTLGYRFASNADSSFNTYITRVDYHVNSSGTETLFARASMQNFNEPGQEEFPGQPASTTIVDDSRGITIGLTSLINPRLINNFHWGYVRQGGQQGGISQNPGVFLSGLSDLYPFTRSTTFFVPVNQFTDTLNWTRKNHTFEFGADFFFIRNDRSSLDDSFSDVQTNPVYLNTGGISTPVGNPSPLNPSNNTDPHTGQPYAVVDQNFGPNYDGAVAILLGIFAEGDGIYNFNHSGTALTQGTPINRRYAINNYEFYGQDTWRVKPSLTVTYGLRWVLEAPPYESNGLQVAPCVEAAIGGCSNQNLGDWFNHTAQLMSQGQPANNAGEISFELGGPINRGPGMWNWDHKDFSPRIAVAWAPDTGDGLASKILGKKDQFTVRGGYSIMYDHFGVPIVNTFDQHGSFGLSTDLGNPAGVVTVQSTPRFTCLVPGDPSGVSGSCLPAPCATLSGPSCLFGPTPSGAFPVTPSNTEFAINWGLDQSLKTPYAHVFNFSLSRQISTKSSLQIAYVGTVGRRLPMQVDLAQPANPTDPASKTTYFQSATMLSKQAAAGVDVNSVQPIPFFENVFPAWAGVATQNALGQNGLNCNPGNLPAKPTATQNAYELYNCYLHNETFALYLMDVPASITGLSPALPNSKNGPYDFYHDQFASLYAWRTIGTSDYNALQATYTVRWGANLQGQFNYTFGKSLDEESAAQRIGPYEGTGGTGSDLNGGGIVINAWDPLALRGLSDYNNRHQINGNLVYRLPFGKNQMLASNVGSVLNELIGGWNVSGIFRWTSGFPITVDNGPDWATDWNIEGDAEPNGPLPKVTNPKNLTVDGQYVGPAMFQNPAAAEAAFRPEWPGESGVRNNVIGQGMFDIDTGVNKSFSLGESRRLEFSWQAFNALNSVRYDVRTAQPDLGYGPTQFGAYTSTLTTPRFMQFALRLVF